MHFSWATVRVCLITVAVVFLSLPLQGHLLSLVSHSSIAEGTLYLNVRAEQLCPNPLALWLAD